MLMSLSLMLHVCHCATSWHISLAHRFTGVLCIKSNFCHCILAQQGLPIPSNSPSLREDAPYNLCKLKIQTGIQMLQKFAQAVFVTCLPWFTDFCQNQIQHEPGKVGWLPRPGMSYERWKRTFHEVCSFYDLLHFENVLGTKYHHMRLKLSMSFPSKSTLQASHLLCCKLKGSK